MSRQIGASASISGWRASAEPALAPLACQASTNAVSVCVTMTGLEQPRDLAETVAAFLARHPVA